MVRVLPLLGLLSVQALSSEPVTPIEKVITLLTDLKAEVEGEGTTEAQNYDTFACFCKSKTTAKSGDITSGQGTIDQLAADIEADSASLKSKKKEVLERKKKQEDLAKQLDEATIRCQKEAAEFAATIADLTKAINSLDKAITALEGSKPSFLQRDAMQQASAALELGDILGLAQSHAKASLPAVLAQLSQKLSPDDATYKFHSANIITTLSEMKTEFTTKKGEVEGERDTAHSACEGLKGNLSSEMETNGGSITTLEGDIGGLETDIAADRSSLVTAQGEMEDDQLYLKDLTERCEARARDWDQRSATRAEEINALTEALSVLQDGPDSVKNLDAVNNRSFVQASSARVVSLLQTSQFNKGVSSHHSSQAEKEEKVREFVRFAASKLKSNMLMTLSAKLKDNPFGEVKQLIQQLIERLLDEATQEATKKGFCDTEVGKAKNDRDARYEDTVKLAAELDALVAKKNVLNESISTLNETIPGLYSELNETTVQRSNDKETNLETIKTAKSGVKAVGKAITILKVFYKNAGKAKLFLQASPVDEDTEGAGFKGSYRGKQSASKGIIGLLQVIESDFDRTARQTKQAEDEAQAEFVKFERTQKADIAAKETTLELDTQEFEVVGNKITRNMEDLTTAQSLLDDALKAIEDLKPMCIDTGMTFAERKAKREEEINALKSALEILKPDDE